MRSSRRGAGTLAILGMFAAAQPALAMTFTLEAAEGRTVVVGRGPIATGDAERLRQALQGADRDALGNKLLVLDSAGGPVAEAFAMVDVMDGERVSTRVRAGASCASACAMIVFVSGALRTVEEGGRLGVHTCHDSASGARSMACNELIAQNALKRGVPYTASLTLMHLTPPGEVRWLDAGGAACWQLSRDTTAMAAAPRGDPLGCPPPLATRPERPR